METVYRSSLLSDFLCTEKVVYGAGVGSVPCEAPPATQQTSKPMTFSCLALWALVLLLLPIHLLLWSTESRSTRIQRLRRNGATWKEIAARYGCSPSTARRWCFS